MKHVKRGICMSYKFEEGKDLIINDVIKKIKQKIKAPNAQLCKEFVLQFLATVSLEDLQDWETDDLYAAIVNFWALIHTRAMNETKIKIYNPDYERHGWQTSHTVIEIICQDMPFLVDSVRMVVNRLGLASHLIIHMGGLRLTRNAQHEITDVLPRYGDTDNVSSMEAVMFIEIDRQTDPQIIEQLQKNLQRVLQDNRAVVDDWQLMREKVREVIDEIDTVAHQLEPAEIEETKAFLYWLEDHHFTFLGVRDYQLVHSGDETILEPLPDTGLGVLRKSLSKSTSRNISEMTPEARELTLSTRILVVSKTNTLSTVHRDAYTDYIGVKRFNKQGEVIGERRLVGLYTSAAYNTNPKHIPFMRHKVALIIENSKLSPRSHAGKVLLNILETLPRDDLIQGSEEELLRIAMGIFYMQERRRIRMFARMDVYHRFVSCLVFVPRERFNTELRQAMQDILSDSFSATETSFSTRFSESILARIHFIIKIDPKDKTHYDFDEIEKKLIEVGRSWTDDLQEYLVESVGEEDANRLFNQYKNAFPAVYTTNFNPRTAVFDIKHIQQLSNSNQLGLHFYRPLDESTNSFKLKIYQHDATIPLSDALPIIENLGMRAISERPYRLKFEGGKQTWINDFALQYTKEIDFNFDEIRELFQNAFTKVWFGDAENDGFNKLVLAAGLEWHQINILRTYAKYFKQIGLTFSEHYITAALNNNPLIVKKLVDLFELRFNPISVAQRDKKITKLVEEILADLDEVNNLDEDKIIRQYVQAISATLRTNYYQHDAHGNPKNYLSIKLNSSLIIGVPKPAPMFEIFVYSPKFEGVHLRCGKVARGGIRWSDRREDFRTEILGLMKAQLVKNSVIVPSGAKGGFVVKQPPVNGSREDIQAEGIRCYQSFIRGLLDITDNYLLGEVIKPKHVVCYDEDDPYLVVAADKGTATFSDIANAISLEYKFWLGDAFASGGSVGYDHKKMGITARGAWESVKRHFYSIGIDVQTMNFTVVGIGDMAGDVFGNGMLLSKHIQLIAAFNHQHIFIDPDPNPEVSYKERKRLFDLPRSSWEDYDSRLISEGGGVFNRNAKSIVVSKEMKQLFEIKQATIEPNELIRLILQAKFDLLWSGGIGTFIKAESQSNTEVGDRTNDLIRINAKQLRCRVIGEGGNLGCTQLGRVEYALNGGLIYTDFIDNSGGVSCSDKEVNIKVLLDQIVLSGDLTLKQRNELLSEMTNEVAQLVLRENYLQTRAISLMSTQAKRSIVLHGRYMTELESQGKLDRALEFLPDEKSLQERNLAGHGLSSPEIAVLLCYSKIFLKEDILASDVPEEPYLKELLVGYFPKPLQARFSKQMENHPLKREIIATRLSNIIINDMGFAFIYRMQDETGAPVSAIVRAYMIARKVLNLESILQQIESLDAKIDAKVRSDLMMIYIRLLRRTTRWFLRNKRTRLDMKKYIDLYGPGIQEMKDAMPGIFIGSSMKLYQDTLVHYANLGISKTFAHELTITRAIFSALDILDIAYQRQLKISDVAELYFGIGEFLDLAWIRTQVIVHPTTNHWELLSREALRDDLDWQQQQLTSGVIQYTCKKIDREQCIQAWAVKNAILIERWRQVLSNLRSLGTLNYTIFFVAIRELLDLTQTTIQSSENALEIN